MFVSPRIGGQLAKDHHQDLLASARRQRLNHQIRTDSSRIAAPGGRVRSRIMSTVARLRPATSA